MVKEIRLTFDDKEFKKLEALKEQAKLDDLVTNWEDYILWKCGVRE